MRAATPSVMNKLTPGPSGDRHDYVSESPYYWPNPGTRDGLPYVYRDGEVNPDRSRYPDSSALDAFIKDTSTLALAYYFTDDQRYADRCAALMRAWFIDDDTRMNPNLNFAQFVPGKNSGTSSGIIDASSFPNVIDAIGLIERSGALTDQDRAGIDRWLRDFRMWLLTSPLGQAESRALNNHGTYFDTQIVALSLHLGDRALAQQTAENARQRVASQIGPDGRQPLELARTRSWHYSLFNLEAFERLANAARHADVDLWAYESSDGRSIRKALDWLVPAASGQQPWTDQDISGFTSAELGPLLRAAAIPFPNSNYSVLAAQVLGVASAPDRSTLIYGP
jgi:hypothetical protein